MILAQLTVLGGSAIFMARAGEQVGRNAPLPWWGLLLALVLLGTVVGAAVGFIAAHYVKKAAKRRRDAATRRPHK